jgi:hypothetical protein
MHLDTILGETHLGTQRQRAWIVRDQSVQVLRDESSKTFAIAIGRCRMTCGRDEKQNQDQLEMLHGV